MKLVRVAAAFIAGAFAGWAVLALIGSAPAAEGDATAAMLSRLEVAQQRIDGLDASLARLTAQMAVLEVEQERRVAQP